MPAHAIFRYLTTLLLAVVCVQTGMCFQASSPESSLPAKNCSKFYLFEFGGYHYYSTVVCSLNLPCSESASEIINIHKEKLKSVGCLPNQTACGCQAPDPIGQIELLRGGLQLAPGNTVLNWDPVEAGNIPKNPQGDKWVANERFSQPKYAATTADFDGIPKGTCFYLVEFQPIVFDYDPVVGIKQNTKRNISGPQYLAIRLSSPPPRGSKTYTAEVVDQKGHICLRVAQHDQLFSAAR